MVGTRHFVFAFHALKVFLYLDCKGSYLVKNNINIFSATLQNSNEYHQENYKEASAIVVGTEATGLTEIWREQATQNINIPMQGKIDSMNVSVAAAIVIFEAKRQREFKM